METIFSAKAWATVWQYRGTFLNGFFNTLQSAVVGLIIALVIGFALGLMATSGKRPLQVFARIYVEFFQNTPLILQVCFLYYALAYSGIKIRVVVIGFISLGLYTGAYVGEVVRAGITSIPFGQFDAARSQGFGYFDTMRLVILPQTIKIILPPLVNQMINLIKNTSCLYIIGGADLIATTYNFVTGESTGGAYGPAYLVGGMMFFCVCYPLSMMAGRWERRLKERDRVTVTPAETDDAKEATA
ncbi:MAG: amino acid ABC transporter permease [Clostridiales bacterium]|nr:amino acid ABC transporter permease [Clostridiales bacterium]MDY5349395.1 amino acid ABC transporter permease [Candidatus Ventricola sp.]MDY5513247.1 amino acid ABC transporter permease [Candidatus Ventricola sp.]